jgi:glucokinase
MPKAVLAVDLGGTNLRMAAVAENGEILALERTPTPTDGQQPFLDALEYLAGKCRGRLTGGHDIVAIGVGAPANIGPQHGVLRDLPNLRQLEGMDLRQELVTRFSIPATLENDATAAAIGENWLGASREVSDSIMVTLGTGVGGGVILNEQPVRGVDGTAGKVGHMCVEPDGHPCKCGSHGCIEQYASATAIVRLAGEAGLTVTSSADVYKMAMAGDERAKSVFEKMGRLLGITLGSLANLLNPQMFIIGGGAAAGWDAFIEHVRTSLNSHAFSEPASRAVIVRSELGDNAGILGAARSAFDHL